MKYLHHHSYSIKNKTNVKAFGNFTPILLISILKTMLLSFRLGIPTNTHDHAQGIQNPRKDAPTLTVQSDKQISILNRKGFAS